MEYKVILDPELNNIQNFKTLLCKYKDYESCIRDIKINTVLGDKCLFEIEDIKRSEIWQVKMINGSCLEIIWPMS